MSKHDAIADRYDRIASSAPVNATAARALSTKGVAEPEPNFGAMAHWDAPPKTFPPPAGTAHRIGKKYGKLTVMGYLGSSPNQGRASQWLVRCLCNRYELRTGKAVERATPHDECHRCRKMTGLQRGARRQAHFDRFGAWPND